MKRKIMTWMLVLALALGSVMSMPIEAGAAGEEEVMDDNSENKSYTVIFNGNGGSVDPASKEVTHGDEYGTLPTPVRDHYIFKGWYTDKENGVQITNESTVDISSNITLYAHWNKIFTVNLNYQNGESPLQKKLEFEEGTTWEVVLSNYDIKAPDYTGHIFDGWYYMKDNIEINLEDDEQIPDGITILARWKAEQYTVTFKGYGTDDLDDITVTYGNTYENLPKPEWENYIFKGWYTTDKGDGEQITNESTVNISSNITLYAHWMKTINVDYGNGSPLKEKIEIALDDRLSDLLSVNIIEIPDYTGYTFNGWYYIQDDKEIQLNKNDKIPNDITVFAGWRANTYIVIFDGNEGTVSPASKEVIYDSTYGNNDSKLPIPKREGYNFEGWYTEKDGGEQIRDDDTVKIISNQTLFAHWTKNPVVIFDGNGGTVSEERRVVVNGEPYGELPVPSKDGYSFTGWYTGEDDGELIGKDTNVNITGEQTLYAHWKANTYTVSFDGNGGSVGTDGKTVTYGEAYGKLPLPVRSGYDFEGWYTEKDGGEQIKDEDTVKVTSNQTLYAHWKANTYTVSFDGNGGSVSTGGKTVTYGEVYGKLPLPVRSGYDFEGWYTEISGGTQVKEADQVMITSNQTVYAHWKKTEQQEKPEEKPAEKPVALKKVTKVEIKAIAKKDKPTIKISWKAVKNADTYQIFIKEGKKDEYKMISDKVSDKKIKWLNKSKTSAFVSGLKADKEYYFKVRACHGSSTGKFSKEVKYRFLELKNLKRESITLGGVKGYRLTWTTPKVENKLSGVQIMKKSTKQKAKTGKWQTSYTIPGNRKQTFKIRAFYKKGKEIIYGSWTEITL